MYNAAQKIFGFIFVSVFIIGCVGQEVKNQASQRSNGIEDQEKPDIKNTETRADTKMNKLNQKEEMPILQTTINLEQNKLIVSYKVQNKTETPIYLFNVLWDMDNTGKYIPAPQPVYSALRDDETLQLAKQILPLPKGKKVELRIIPYVTKVEANGEFSEKIILDVPVEEYNLYFPKDDNTEYEIRTSESVIFTIQFIRESDKLKVNEAQIKDALSVWHPDLFGNVETLVSKPSPMEVKVNKRLDKFESF